MTKARHAIYQAWSPGPVGGTLPGGAGKVLGWAGFVEVPGVGCHFVGWKRSPELVRDEIVGAMWDAGIRRSLDDHGDEINAERVIR